MTASFVLWIRISSRSGLSRLKIPGLRWRTDKGQVLLYWLRFGTDWPVVGFGSLWGGLGSVVLRFPAKLGSLTN